MSQKKILIVEDDVDFSGTLTMALEINDHTAVVAHNGLEAIDHVRKQVFDVCFLDIKMPEMTGIECLEVIKDILPPETTFIMMTGFRDEETLARAKEVGAEHILLKPFKMSEFVECAQRNSA